MSRIKFTEEIPMHETGDVFELVGFGGTAKKTFKVLSTEGATATISEVIDGKCKRGRPMKVLMVEDFKEPEYFEIPF